MCWELPYPPNQGGRVDSWRRVEALHKQGVAIQLICWAYEDLPPADMAVVLGTVDALRVITIRRDIYFRLRKLVFLYRYPLMAAVRKLSFDEFRVVSHEVAMFSPELIFLDGIHGGVLGISLSKNLSLPLVVRSHNIEHQYYRALYSSASGIRAKIKLGLSLLNLKRHEFNVLSKSSLFLDISVADLKYWDTQGLKNGKWLPTFYSFGTRFESPSKSNALAPKTPTYDICFLGNLNSPNNVEGIRWLIYEVFPIVISELQDVKLLLAGSNPNDDIKKMCKEVPGLYLHANPADVNTVYRDSCVLVNPVLRGSGVNVKSIEMLLTGNQVVTTPQGVAGLPNDILDLFNVASTSILFAEKIILSIKSKSQRNFEFLNSRMSALDAFDINKGGKMLTDALEITLKIGK